MARVEWIKQRLDNWARWKDREKGSGLGFYSQSAFLRMAVDGGGFRDASIPVDDVEASKTDRAVQALRGPFPHLHRTIELIYLEDTGVPECARQLCRAVSTVHANLALADLQIATYLRQLAEEAEQRAERSSTT
jgi:hypothetical protein